MRLGQYDTLVSYSIMISETVNGGMTATADCTLRSCSAVDLPSEYLAGWIFKACLSRIATLAELIRCFELTLCPGKECGADGQAEEWTEESAPAGTVIYVCYRSRFELQLF